MTKKTKRTTSHRKGSAPGVASPDQQRLLALVAAGNYAALEAEARRVLARSQYDHLALKALSIGLLGQDRIDEAERLLVPAVKLYGTDAELHNNLGIVYSLQLRWDRAIACFDKAIALDAGKFETHKNLGVAYIRMQRWQAAIAPLLRAIELHGGDYVEAVGYLAQSLEYAGHIDEAWTCYRELHDHDPDHAGVLTQLLAANLLRCDWGGFDDLFGRWQRLAGQPGANPGNTFALFAFPGVTGEAHRRFAEAQAAATLPQALLDRPLPATGSAPAPRGERLRIGYLSADFRRHPVGFVIPEVIERHDRSRLQVVGYSLAADDGSAIRRRLADAFDAFVDLENVSPVDAAERIRADGIDILIDLQGYTSNGRPEILAMRPAPVQAGWLGYAGTMGHARLADYLIGDPVATPAAHAGFYTEALAQMPCSYMPADTRRTVAPPPSRAEAGLPDGAFVFCSFNSSYKFNPPVFDLWCRLLQACPDSVLWLSKPGEVAQENLLREAAARGIEPSRILFAPRVEDYAGHLARLALADLALDTFPYNSHSTGVDTLWAGVPMVTCLGDIFPARVGASLLHAAGLAELVAASPEAYLAIALELHRDPVRLRDIRQRLVESRASLPLFDMQRFVADLERLYFRMWDNFSSGRREAILSQSAPLPS